MSMIIPPPPIPSTNYRLVCISGVFALFAIAQLLGLTYMRFKPTSEQVVTVIIAARLGPSARDQDASALETPRERS